MNFNYRLGPLGFPQGAEAERKGILNLALKDQLAALKWWAVTLPLHAIQSQIVTIGYSTTLALSAETSKKCASLLTFLPLIDCGLGDHLWSECREHHVFNSFPKLSDN